MKIYRIRHKESGLFSKGGARLEFSKKGKIWTNIRYVKNHFHYINTLNWAGYSRLRDSYIANTEIIEYNLTSGEDAGIVIEI